MPGKAVHSPRARHSGSEITCAKCGHVNPHASNTCERCQAHMWVSCRHCGHRNTRAEEHCTECGQRLHRSALKKLRKKLGGGTAKFRWWYIPLLVAAVSLAYKVIVFLVEFRLQPVE